MKENLSELACLVDHDDGKFNDDDDNENDDNDEGRKENLSELACLVAT